MVEVPLVAGPLYGLRSWAVTGDAGRERLTGTRQPVQWPAAGEWLDATCARTPEHAAPVAGCWCGIHAWHPGRASARRVFAVRREIPGVVEATGAIEVHEDRFRAERARPYALVALPGRNPALVRRLAAAHRAEVIEADRPEALLDWCRSRGLGLSESVVTDLLGRDRTEARRRARRRGARRAVVRTAAILAAIAAMLVLGLELATDPPGDRVLYGRTGEVHVHR